jgi:hypothetical protein
MKKLLIHYGLLHTINGLSDVGWANELLNKFDDFVFQVPMSFDTTNLKPVATSDTTLYFECIRLLNKPHFIYVACDWEGTYPNSLAGKLTAIQNSVNEYLNWYNFYNVDGLLKGFFFDEFGWDYFPGYSEVDLRNFNNSIINFAHLNGKSAFVNPWFMHQVFIERDDLSQSVWGRSEIRDYILSESIFSYDLKRVSYTLAIKGLIKKKNLNGEVYFVQAVNFAMTTINPKTYTLNMDAEVRKGFNYYCVGALLGINGGVADIDYGASSNKVLNYFPKKLDEIFNDEVKLVVFPDGYYIYGNRRNAFVSPDFEIKNFDIYALENS